MPLTTAGLQIPTVQELIAGFVEREREEIDPLLDVDAESPIGQLNGIVASALREGYEVAQTAYHAIDPDGSEAAELEMLSAITGTFRAAAVPSRFAGVRRITVELDASTTLPAGSTCEVFGAPTVRFVTTQAVTSTASGTYPVAAECTQTGPIDVAIGALSVITTPVAGWLSVTNTTGPIIGRNADDDEQLRDRRERELRALGSASVDAIAARIAAIEVDGERPVISCSVFENTTSVTDALGIPPHTIEALVWDGLGEAADDDTIAQVIWDAKAGGIGTFGSVTGDAVGRNGQTKFVRFSRPTLRVAGVEGNITALPGFAGIGAVRQAVAAYFDSIPPGAPDTNGEIKWSLVAQAILTVPGVISVNGILVGVAGDSISIAPHTNRPIGARDKPVGDISAVDITVST